MKYVTEKLKGWLCMGCIMSNTASAYLCESFANARVAEGLPHCFDNENIIYVEDKNEV